MQSAMMTSKLLVLVAAVLVCLSTATRVETICERRCRLGIGGGNLCNCGNTPFQGKRSDNLASVEDTLSLEQRDPAFPTPLQDHSGGMYRRFQDVNLDSDRRRFLGKILRSMLE